MEIGLAYANLEGSWVKIPHGLATVMNDEDIIQKSDYLLFLKTLYSTSDRGVKLFVY